MNPDPAEPEPETSIEASSPDSFDGSHFSTSSRSALGIIRPPGVRHLPQHTVLSRSFRS